MPSYPHTGHTFHIFAVTHVKLPVFARKLSPGLLHGHFQACYNSPRWKVHIKNTERTACTFWASVSLAVVMAARGSPRQPTQLEVNDIPHLFSEIIQKFNPYHDKLGRFTTGGMAASFTYAPGKSKAHDLAIEREKQRMAGGGPAPDGEDIGSLPEIPKRPRKSDFENEEDYYKARDSYRKEKESALNRVGEMSKKQSDIKEMSDEEFSSWCKKNNVSVNGSLDGMDRRALTSYTKRYEQLIKDYPEVNGFKMHLDGETYTSRFSIGFENTREFFAEASSGMKFGGSFKNFEDAARGFITQQAEGFNVKTKKGVLSLYDHEFGHNLYSSMRWGQNGTRQRVEMENDLIKSLYGKKGMSEYATTNAEELFAEGFAAFYGGEKTEFAIATGAFIRRWRKK